MVNQKSYLNEHERKLLQEMFVEVFGELGSDKRNSAVKDICGKIGAALQQEYKFVNGEWWLYTFGRPARKLTDEEVSSFKAEKHE